MYTDLGYCAYYIYPDGYDSGNGVLKRSYECIQSPDTYMGGSEGVMQVTDYGDIQFETWLHVSYGIW